MKIILRITVMCFSVSALADVRGFNEAGEEISAYLEGTWIVTESVDGKDKRVFKDQSCGYSGLYGQTFSCASEGNSPLAGTTYVYREELDNCRGSLFVCSSGCNRRAPKELVGDHEGECQEAMEEAERRDECNKKDRQGAYVTIIADKVNLMDTPSGKVLRTLNIGTKAKLILGDGICTCISGTSGQWIKVNITDKKTAEDGWIFDADVEYHNNP